MARVKSIDQEELKGMESEKNADIERAAKRYRKTITERIELQGTEKNQKAKVRELMHANVKPIVVNGEERLVYKRADIEVTVRVTEKVRVLLDDEVSNPEEESGDDEVTVS
jgi:hypothetical protein